MGNEPKLINKHKLIYLIELQDTILLLNKKPLAAQIPLEAFFYV